MTDRESDQYRARVKLHARLSAQVDRAENERLDAANLTAARQCVVLWHRWWSAGKAFEVDDANEMKMRIVFPLAMHAMANVELALKTMDRIPWVAAGNTRIAFEHALAAQWVLLTDGGEQHLLDAMRVELDKRTRGVYDGLGQPPEYAAMVDEQRPNASYTVWNACSRFAEPNTAKLFYDIYRHLGEGAHPSIGSLTGYVSIDIQRGAVRRWERSGTLRRCEEISSGLALSALWAMDALEELRTGQPNVAQLNEVGDAAELPYTLRHSDRRPHLQHPPATKAESG